MSSGYDTNIPGATGASGYADSALAANTAYKNTLARINQKRSDTLRQAGYTGSVDPTSGTVSNLHVDPNNAYGGLQSMLRTQANDFQQADYAAEDRGLHGGLAHKADSDLKYQHGAQAAQFGQGLTSTIGGYQGEQNQAAYSRDQALSDAELAQLRSAIDSQSFNPGDYSGLDYAPYGADPSTVAAPSVQAKTLANKVISQATKKAVANSSASKASTAAAVAAKKAGASQAAIALAARSAGLNAKYKIGRR